MATIRAALVANNIERAFALIRRGANVNAVDAEGKTALRFAASLETPEVLLALLERGARVNFQGPDGTTALMIAAKNSLRNTEILLARGASVTLQDDAKETVMFYAVRGNNPTVLTTLAAATATVDVRNNKRLTPLIIAAATGKPDMVAELLRLGANPTLTDENGITALGYSITRLQDGPSHKAVYSILRSLVPAPPATAATAVPATATALPVMTTTASDFKILCDPIGYDQHSGECWIDTIQQLFFFSDAVRNHTQPLFYFMTDPDLDEYIRAAVMTGVLPESMVPDLRAGCIAMRNRFINHYNYIRYNESVLACLKGGRVSVRRMYNALLDVDTLAKREKSGEYAVAVGAFFQSEKKKSDRVDGKYSPGERKEYGLRLFTLLFYIFRIPFLCRHPAVALEHNMPVYALNIGLDGYSFKDGTLKDTNSAHATGFFRCSGRWAYYDDNVGAIPTTDMFVHELKRVYAEIPTSRPAICVATPLGSLNTYFFKMDGMVMSPKKYNQDIAAPATWAGESRKTEAQFREMWIEDKWVPYRDAKGSLPRGSPVLADLMDIEKDIKKEFFLIHSVHVIIDDPSVRVGAVAATAAAKSSTNPWASKAAAAATAAPAPRTWAAAAGAAVIGGKAVTPGGSKASVERKETRRHTATHRSSSKTHRASR